MSLAHLSLLLSPASFVVDGYIGLGVPIGTDAFIQRFVKDKCQAIMEDVDNIPLSASSSRCTRTSYSTMTALISRSQHSPRRRLTAVALLKMQAQNRNLRQTPTLHV
jgi:hypothetical protein